MKKFGIVTYNRYCNFTNYGSALQSWALYTIINKLGKGKWNAIHVKYCPDVHRDSDPLNPMKKMWDLDEDYRKLCELSLPAIKENFYKFEDFYNNRFISTQGKYNSDNFDEIICENIDGFICGCDTIFCIDEFGLDNGFYSNYDCMKNGYSVSYGASFGDPHFTSESLLELNKLLENFNYIAIRENDMLNYVNDNTVVPVKRVLDSTLILKPEDYEELEAPKQEDNKYLLVYSRRHNDEMYNFAEEFAKENGWEIIEISLRGKTAKHKVFYEAGVEEFLSLVKHAEYVITNSYHGMIFSIQYKVPFYTFNREQNNIKTVELLDLLEIPNRLIVSRLDVTNEKIDYDKVHKILERERERSLKILNEELSNCK